MTYSKASRKHNGEISTKDALAAHYRRRIRHIFTGTGLSWDFPDSFRRGQRHADASLPQVPGIAQSHGDPALRVRRGRHSGGAKGNRTPDLLDANESRYQLRHSPVVGRDYQPGRLRVPTDPTPSAGPETAPAGDRSADGCTAPRRGARKPDPRRRCPAPLLQGAGPG